MTSGGSFSEPLKCNDVVKRTNATLGVLLERRIDDYWNVDGGRAIGTMDQFHSVHNVERKASKWLRVVLSKVHATSRPDCVWPGASSNMSKSSQQEG